uniref:Endosome-associated-trafficking regulator 1 n=1 Tax=Fopius arisanus TaxID=64838 RepID=A0A0C9QZ13_9HYME
MASRRGRRSSSSSSSSLEELSKPTRERANASRENVFRIRNDNENQDLPRRSSEENPFSFKHFLKNDPQTNYQYTGARPKVYSSGRKTNDTSALENESVYTRNPTELPDFVQDHLVIEQCYLNHESAPFAQVLPNVDHLPDFAINSVEQRSMCHRAEGKSDGRDLPFDLTGSIDRRKRRRDRPVPNSSPLDNPEGSGFGRNHEGSPAMLDPMAFPLDLPLNQELNGPINPPGIAQPAGDASIPNSLPDFLSDGPIRNRVAPQQEVSTASNLTEPLDRRLLLEIDLLRHDLQMSRRQNNEQNRRIQVLEAELSSRRAVDHEETVHLEKAMEQVEDNLKRSTRRAVNAESAVTVLKQEVKTLKLELLALRDENRELRGAMGASCSDSRSTSSEKKNTETRWRFEGCCVIG